MLMMTTSRARRRRGAQTHFLDQGQHDFRVHLVLGTARRPIPALYAIVVFSPFRRVPGNLRRLIRLFLFHDPPAVAVNLS